MFKSESTKLPKTFLLQQSINHRKDLRTMIRYSVSGAAVFLLIYLLLNGNLRKRCQRRFFSWIFANYLADLNKKVLLPHKSSLFSSLQSIFSIDHNLASQGAGKIRILEIGVGSGSNLAFYPSGSHLITVEPNDNFRKYFELNKSKFSHIIVENCINSSAENMDQVPDNSIDVVVSTHVLCSVESPEQCLQEIKRVLVSGGKFYYLEHVADSKRTWCELLQIMVTPIWQFVFDGCSLTRNLSDAIMKTRFSEINETRLHINKMQFLVKPHIIGIATK